MKTSIILFSRDRAMQLDSTLRSLLLHCADAPLASLFVLYKATTPRHQRQYGILERQFAVHPFVRFVPQGDFRRDLLKLALLNVQLGRQAFLVTLAIRLGRVASAAASRVLSFESDAYIMFLVDDNIFVRDFSLCAVTHALDDHPDVLGFSLRLGANTTNCYSHARQQALPPFEPLADGMQKYAWFDAEADFGYPLELSSSVYRTRQILPLLMWLRLGSPNQLEGGLSGKTGQVQRQGRCLLCFTQSVAFSNPLNRVQSESDNRVASSQQYTAEALAALFDKGYRIAVNRYAGFVPQACHQEVELEFEPHPAEAGLLVNAVEHGAG